MTMPTTALALRNKRSANRRARARVARSTARWQSKFLKALRQFPSVKHASKIARVDRTVAYKCRNNDSEFAARWSQAIEYSLDAVEARIFKMALEGGGDAVSANLCTWLLRCHRPVPYDPVNRSEVAVAGGIIFLPEKKAGSE